MSQNQKSEQHQADRLAAIPGIPARFEVHEIISKGSSGFLYRAHDSLLSRNVAIKVLNLDSLSDFYKERFLLEAKALAQLKHPNIVQILSFGITEQGSPYYVMELLSGETLAQELERFGRLESKRFYELSSQLCQALAEIHKQDVVHRDLKPGNIIQTLDQDGKQLAKIIDFGVALLDSSVHSGDTMTLPKNYVGTVRYMSPEQCRGERGDKLSDIFSLGCIMYECISGEAPLSADAPAATIYRHLNEDAAALKFRTDSEELGRLSYLIARCLERDKNKRIAEALEIKKELDEIFASGSLELSLVTEASKADASKNLKNMILGCLLVLLLIGIGIYYRKSGDRQSDLNSGRKPVSTAIAKPVRVRLSILFGDWRQIRESTDEKAMEGRREILRKTKELLPELINKSNLRFAAYEFIAVLQRELKRPISEQLASEESALNCCEYAAGDYVTNAARPLCILSEIYLDLGKKAEAERYAQRCLSLVDNSLLAKREGKEIRSFQNIDDFDSFAGKEKSRANLVLGVIYLERGDFAKGEAYFNEAQSFQHGSKSSKAESLQVQRKAEIYIALDKPVLAERAVRNYLEQLLDPEYNQWGIDNTFYELLRFAKWSSEKHFPELSREIYKMTDELAKTDSRYPALLDDLKARSN
ncbi:MAG: serine/threonine protein kinase [Candidatus Obscuribacterales bacterium]|nr:serine/threonine protein kinase [Candidatus Obscuribacterales bacterium]